MERSFKKEVDLLRLAQTIFVGALLAGVLGNIHHAAAQNPIITTTEEIWSVRPANIFTLSENSDPSVCGPLLVSLNTAAPRRSMSTVFPLMKNKFITNEWRWQNYYWTPRPGARRGKSSWAAVFLDMDGDGVKDGLFRKSISRDRNLSHWSWFVPSIDPAITSSNLLSEPVARRIFDEHRLSFEDLDPGSYEDWQFVEVVVIKGRPFLLISRALTLEKSDSPSSPRVQLLRRSSQQFERVCSFDGQILIEGSR